ncbi:MAG: xanthine phosphoribosyltransferase [Bacillota bacterium]
MELLKRKILECGKIIDGRILKVDSFLNHQMDVVLFNEIGKEFKARFQDVEVSKILTLEASGIGIACITAQYFKVPVLFAKKHESSNMDQETYQSEVYSYTRDKLYKIRVARKFLHPADKILIIDDFLANGKAVAGLIHIVQQAGAQVAGVGIVIEKGFQKGREVVEKKGIRVESLAIIESMSSEGIVFK